MSSVDLHPEDLIDRARRGAISAEETARLRAHLAGCPACRFEHVLAEDCARAAAGDDSPAGDALLWARVQRAASRAVRARGGGFAARAARSRRRPSRLVYAAAAVFLFAAAVATATTVVWRAWRGPEVASLEPGSVRAPVDARGSRAGAPTLRVEDSAAEAEPAEATVEAPAVVALPAARGRARVAAAVEPPAALFARANAARRAGQTREAARLYQQLQREFPGSSEELVSRVTLGRWMLDRLHDPAGALGRFDSYLANPVHTALREEALIGRALALGRLGRRIEERGAWTAFLAAFPRSVYAERARGRLETLR